MAAGLPVAASRVGALGELVDERGLVPAGDAGALAAAIGRLAGDRATGERSLERIRGLCAPVEVAEGLRRVYEAATTPDAGEGRSRATS
jgi:glycosyltransferase involved in cell wall biosynthesis